MQNLRESDALFRLQDQKLAPPQPGSALLERPALLQKLLGLRAHRFVLLSAPAGYGKTSLMGHYHDHLHANGEQVAWLTLDACDNDPARLRRYLGAALSPVLAPKSPGAAWAIATESSDPCTVFIDDLHVLSEDAAGVLRELLTEWPAPFLRVVLGSRNSSELVLSILRRKGKIGEVDRADLAFSLADTKAYLQRQLGDMATEPLVEALYRHTEGWPVALQLASASLRQRGVCGSVAVEGMFADLRSMAAFLTDDVLKVQSAQVQEFLLDVAVANQFSAALCEKIRGSGDNEERIGALFDAGIPVRQLDAGWYQLHPLFASHIRSLAKKRDPGQFAENGRIAAAWLVNDGRSVDAVEALLSTGNAGNAVQLMEQLACPLLFNAQYETAIRWCESLPVETVQSNAVLCSTYTFCLVVCNRRAQAADWSRRCVAQSEVAGADAIYASTAQLVQMYELVARGTPEQLASAAPILEEAVLTTTQFERGSFANLLTYVHLAAGNFADAEKSILIAKRIFREEKRFVGLATAHYLEAIAAAAQGRLREAVGHLETVSLLGRENQKRTPPGYLYAMSAGFTAALYYELNELDQAESWVRADRCASELSTSCDSILCGTLVGFRLALLRGRLPEAFAQLEARLAIAQEGGFPYVAHALELELARYAAVNNQAEKAQAHRAQLLEDLESLKAHRHIRPSEETEGAGIAQARLMLHLGLLQEGIALVDALLSEATARKRRWREVKLRILRAIALEKLGNAAEAAQEITCALELGASMGLVRTFLDEGKAFVEQLRLYAKGPHRASLGASVAAYLISLLKASEAESVVNALPVAMGFSEQESRVLELIARGQTNKDVASALALSVNTIKWHLTHIYTKLGVHNRSQAVFVARQRGLMG